MYRTLYRQVDLSTIRENMTAIRRAAPPGVEVMAVVKADAYGHGLLPVAKAVLAAGAGWLAVAIPEEGEALRRAGVTAPILVLGPLAPGEAEAVAALGLTATICSPEMVHALGNACRALKKEAQVHLKVDTGMSRIGIRTPAEKQAILTALEQEPQVRLTGAFTHFADADGDSDAFTRLQFQRFLTLTEDLQVMRHCANSAALARFPEMSLQMVRAGIALYGCPPLPTAIPLRPAMRWITAIAFLKEIAPGDTVSYGRTFTAQTPLRVATLPVGYGDGYHRAVSGRGGYVLIAGRAAPILGRICMDQMMVDVTGIPEARIGSEAVLLGRQGEAEITADQLAGWAGTISYEVLLAPTSRVPRLYLHE